MGVKAGLITWAAILGGRLVLALNNGVAKLPGTQLSFP